MAVATGLPADVVSGRFQPQEFNELLAADLLEQEQDVERQEWMLNNFAHLMSELRNIQVILLRIVGGSKERLTTAEDFTGGNAHQLRFDEDTSEAQAAAMFGPKG